MVSKGCTSLTSVVLVIVSFFYCILKQLKVPVFNYFVLILLRNSCFGHVIKHSVHSLPMTPATMLVAEPAAAVPCPYLLPRPTPECKFWCSQD